MWRPRTLAAALAVVLVSQTAAFQMGAPGAACSEMTPAHTGFAPQPGFTPYRIIVSNTTLQQGKRLKLTISRGDELPFKGFFVQARRVAEPSGPAVGRFYTKQHSTVSCGTAQDNAITHSDSKEKELINLLWESPTDLDEDVAFRVSVVQNYGTFWVNQSSLRVRVSASGTEPPAPGDPAATTTTTEAPEEEDEEEEEEDMTDALVGLYTMSEADDERRRRPWSGPWPWPWSWSWPGRGRGRGRSRQRAKETTTTTTTTTTTQASCGEEKCDNPTTAASTAVRSGIATIFDTCLLAKGCFTLQDDCIQTRSCNMMVTYARQPGGAYRFQLYGLFNPGNYIGVGLSRDGRMGDDAVIYCTQRLDGGFQVLHAYNVGRESVPMRATSRVGRLMSDVGGEFRDGKLLCEFTHSQRFTIRGEDFDLASDDLYLMLASGTASVDGERRPQYHGNVRRSSGAPVRLHLAQGVVGDNGALFRLHGALMLVAWLCTASVGMLIARYYKTTWPGRQLGGKDAWFQVHLSLMVLTLVLSLVALVVVAYQLQGWSGLPISGVAGANPHPLLGILSIVLALLQPLMAMCRCHPTASRRPIFNWAHWLVGTGAHLLAVAAVFFAVALPAAQLPFWTYWVLAVFVVFHVFIHLALSVQQCMGDRSARLKVSSEAYSMRDMGNNGYLAHHDRSDDGKASVVRRVLLGLYIVVNVILVTLLVIMVVLAPAESWGVTDRIRRRFRF